VKSATKASSKHHKELFENVDATTIMDFIKEVNFYHLV